VSRAAREWVRGLGEHLTGPPRALLWATADRANNEGRFWTSERTIASESGVSYREVRYLLPILVSLDVLAMVEKHRGTRPAVYAFTLRDPTGLPSAAPRTALEPELVRHHEPLVRHRVHASAAPGAAKPEEPGNHPAKGGCLVRPESNDRDRDGLAADAAAAPAPAAGVPQHIKDEWRWLLVPPPSETDSVEEAAKKRAARERLARHEREAADEASQERGAAS
jgi:hypothetical protein